MPELTELSRKGVTKKGQTYFRSNGMVFRNLRFRWKLDFEKVFFQGERGWIKKGVPPGNAKSKSSVSS